MGSGLKRLPVIFYHTPGGAEPVRDWLNGLPLEDRRTLGHDIRTVELAGRSECRFAGLLAADCGRCGATFPATGRPA